MRSSGPLRIKHPHLPPMETEMDACSSELSLYFFFPLLVRYRYFSALENVLNKWASYIYVFNVICLYLFGWSQFMPSEKVKSPGNWIIPFICRHDAVQERWKGASLSCPAHDLTPDLDVGSQLWASSPRLGWPPSGDGLGAQQVLRVCGGVHRNYLHKHLRVSSVLFCSQLPGGHSPRPGLLRSCLERSSTHTFIPSTPPFANLSSHQLFPQT